MSCYPDLAFCHYCFSHYCFSLCHSDCFACHYCLVLVIPNEVRNLLFAGLVSARRLATENLGCPVSRVLCEKRGFSLSPHTKKRG
jgi:hypothetical protein